MKIAALKIDGYGVWRGLEVQRLGEGMNVLYGPNEAGKTTLLEFVRSVLYGFSPERRRYFPPLHGGRPGGCIEIAAPNGRFQIERHDDADGQPGSEQLILTAADGTRQGEHVVKVLLSNIDETIFNNIFAVGLREMQELGALSDTAAAELLYNLQRRPGPHLAGRSDGRAGNLAEPHPRPQRRAVPGRPTPGRARSIRQEIEQLDEVMRSYGRLAAQRHQLDRELARLEEEKNRAEYQARVVDLAISLRERWQRRTEMDHELAALGPQTPMPEDAVPRLDALSARSRSTGGEWSDSSGSGQSCAARARPWRSMKPCAAKRPASRPLASNRRG